VVGKRSIRTADLVLVGNEVAWGENTKEEIRLLNSLSDGGGARRRRERGQRDTSSLDRFLQGSRKRKGRVSKERRGKEKRKELDASRKKGKGRNERLTSSSVATSRLFKDRSLFNHSTMISRFPWTMSPKSASVESGIALRKHDTIWDRFGSGTGVGVSNKGWEEGKDMVRIGRLRWGGREKTRRKSDGWSERKDGRRRNSRS